METGFGRFDVVSSKKKKAYVLYSAHIYLNHCFLVSVAPTMVFIGHFSVYSLCLHQCLCLTQCAGNH